MKQIIIAIAFLLTALLSACGDGSNVSQTNESGYPDEMFYSDYDNVQLVVMRVDDRYITYSQDTDYWVEMYLDPPAGIAVPDGGFALITADITRMSGGIAGFMGNPRIDKLRSAESMTLDEAVKYCGITEYGTETTLFSAPQICNGCCVFRLHSEYYVYRDGTLVGIYGSSPEAEAAMGLRELPEGVKTEEMGIRSLYVFRCGDTYLAYSNHIDMNRYWMPLLNADFGNIPDGFTLEDGECAEVWCDRIIRVNGGDAGYVNAPMITGTERIEKCVYYDVELHCPVEHWEESLPTETDNLRQFLGSGCDYLIFYREGSYRVYADNYETQWLVGVYDDYRDADAALGYENRR